MFLEIHCPECGEFKHDNKARLLKACPRCGNKQAIILGERRDIEDRFSDERKKAKAIT